MVNKRNKEYVLSVIKRRHPETIEDLAAIVKKDSKISEEELVKIVHELEEEKKLEFNEVIFPLDIKSFFFSYDASWYWAVLLISFVSAISVFVIPEDFFPFAYLRNVFGVFFLFYLPGYAFIKLLFPISVPLKTRSITLDIIERVALSIGLSLAVSPMVGLVLFYTPLGLNLVPITLSVLGLIVAFATLAVLHEFRLRNAIFMRKARKNDAYFHS